MLLLLARSAERPPHRADHVVQATPTGAGPAPAHTRTVCGCVRVQFVRVNVTCARRAETCSYVRFIDSDYVEIGENFCGMGFLGGFDCFFFLGGVWFLMRFVC